MPDAAQPARKSPACAFASTDATFGTAGVKLPTARTPNTLRADPEMLTHQRHPARPLSQRHHQRQAATPDAGRQRLRGSSPASNRTCEVSSRFGIWKLQQLPSSQFRGTFHVDAPEQNTIYAVDRG